jgi:sugar lactone lactonase YvrE/regulation of enolase protein 1 (concanavalin A-like superfamily)
MAQPVGMFEAHGDVGENPKKGSIEFDSTRGEYRVTGGGANMWEKVDAFQFAWKRLSGDVDITADVHFLGVGKEDHRKAVLVIRQSLDAGSPYADVALHGDGLTSLQYRTTAGVDTEEVQSTVRAPVRIRIERRGNQFTMRVGKPGEELTPSGPVTVALQDPVYVGIGVCSHDAQVLETAVFSNVKIETPQQQPQIRSKVSVYDLNDKSVKVIYTADKLFEAPNWLRDGKHLLANSGGDLYRIPLDGGEPEKVNIGEGYRCNNDHGFSPDTKLLAISCESASSEDSQVYLSSLDGSAPKLMTPKAPSYFHGWSPDGKWLAFVGERDGHFNLFRVAVAGGEEQRLTSKKSYDDGPDYSPDGKWIYFNSDRSGSWDIWRMPADGAGPDDKKAERVTSDELEDWFPHPSPDGKWLVFLSFPKGTAGHDDRMKIQFRMMPLPGKKLKPGPIQVVTELFGGQGTINVNSWSPDSKKFAFVSYEILGPRTRRRPERQFELKAESDNFWKLVDRDAKLEKVAGDFGFTEGPVWDSRGFLYVSDEEQNWIFRVFPDGRREKVFQTGDPDGSTYDRSHRLITTASVLRAIVEVKMDGTYRMMADKFEGKRLNSPNDIVLGPDGALYFTDPTLDLPEGQKQELAFQGVFRLGEDGALKLLTKELHQPNGLAFSPDGKKLYVDDSATREIHVYDAGADGTLTNGRLFGKEQGPPRSGVPDGMKVDREGNVYVTGPLGIWVWDPSGNHVGTIVVPEQPANLAWGDADFGTLYLTAEKSVYRIKTKTRGFVPYEMTGQ